MSGKCDECLVRCDNCTRHAEARTDALVAAFAASAQILHPSGGDCIVFTHPDRLSQHAIAGLRECWLQLRERQGWPSSVRVIFLEEGMTVEVRRGH